MNTRKICMSFILASALVLALTASAFPQSVQPIVVNKRTLAAVSKGADGNLWTTAQSAFNYGAMLVSIRKTGSISGCTATVVTGPTAATATIAVNDANASIDCATASVNKVVNSIDNYFNIVISSWSSTGSISVTVTLLNGAGWTMNGAISAVTQGAGAATPGTVPWYVQGTDGTNKTPAADAIARSRYVIPSNGTTAFADQNAGVKAAGVGVQQVAHVNTLSAAVASATMTEVVAVTGSGVSTHIAGIIVEKAAATTGSITLTAGTGTNCGTSGVVIVGPIIAPPSGYIPLGIVATAARAICITTEGANTSARILYK